MTKLFVDAPEGDTVIANNLPKLYSDDLESALRHRIDKEELPEPNSIKIFRDAHAMYVLSDFGGDFEILEFKSFPGERVYLSSWRATPGHGKYIELQNLLENGFPMAIEFLREDVCDHNDHSYQKDKTHVAKLISILFEDKKIRQSAISTIASFCESIGITGEEFIDAILGKLSR